jgi:hypothetical protein
MQFLVKDWSAGQYIVLFCFHDFSLPIGLYFLTLCLSFMGKISLLIVNAKVHLSLPRGNTSDKSEPLKFWIFELI